jgi:hypothetical protein
MRSTLLLVTLLLTPCALTAQHSYAAAGATFDQRVPTPRSVLGYEVGERFTTHHMVLRFFERVAQSSPRVVLDTIGHTFEGREYVSAIVTSERNHARLAQIRADARRLADPRGAAAAELDGIVARMPAVVMLAYTVHGGEASGTEASLATLYQLAAGTDAATLALLDSAVVLIDPIQNPDGHERHVQDVMRKRGLFGPDPAPGGLHQQGCEPFDSAVILLDQIVQIFALALLDRAIGFLLQGLQSGRIGAALVDGDLLGQAVVADGFL